MPCQLSDPEYDAGYGFCGTYSPGKSNHAFCSEDENVDGVKAENACEECGKCSHEERREQCPFSQYDSSHDVLR